MEDKYAHGQYPVELDLATDGDYEAITDGLGRPIPFQLNCAEGGIVAVKLADSAAFVDMYFGPGPNPDKVIAVDADSTMSTGLVAVYPYKPATTTIKTV